ncbi:MAG: ester cyclase, partial [Thermoleophilaceae bacterium]
MSEDLIQAAREEIDAFNAGDWDRLAAGVTEDTVHEEPATGRRVQGMDALIELNQAWKAAFPDARGTVTEELACGDRVVLRITWEGTQSGALELPGGGQIPPTGKRVTVYGCQIFRIEDGRIAESVHYFDMLGMFE